MCFAKRLNEQDQLGLGSQASQLLIGNSSLEISRIGGCSEFFNRIAFIFISATLHTMSDRYMANRVLKFYFEF